MEARWESKLTQDERNAFTAKAKSLWDEDVDESNGLIPTLSRAHAPVQPTASATTKPPRRAPAAPAVVPAEGAPGPATRTRAKKTESSQQAPESPTL